MGAEVVAVGSAKAAMEALEKDRPHILVSDIAMPEIDGYGFRSLEENQHVEFEVAQGPKGLQATRVRAV